MGARSPALSPGEVAEGYRALRVREGWAVADGREDPEGGEPRLWGPRLRSVARAARIFDAGIRASGSRPLVVDAGAGGGWAGRLLPGCRVVGIDLIQAPAAAGLFVRADMLRMPFVDGQADGVLFAASLRYAEPGPLAREVARVLKRGGLLVAVDSPIYRDARRAEAAKERARAYYERAGFPSLAARYHPIDAGALRRALTSAGLAVERLELGSRFAQKLLGGRAAHSLVVARLT